MELEGFIRAIKFLKSMNMKIYKMVTDRHV